MTVSFYERIEAASAKEALRIGRKDHEREDFNVKREYKMIKIADDFETHLDDEERAYQFVEHLFNVNDARIADKWGAGRCLKVTTGVYVFFGLIDA